MKCRSLLAVFTLLTCASVNAGDSGKLTGEESVKLAKVPEGFELKLFATEPDIVNPISFCIDDRGRLWVAEGFTYPIRAKDGEGQDRIVVFEDAKGEGHWTKRTVFMEHLNLVSGIEYGYGGLFVGAAPYFMFIPIADGETPKPAGEPKILLDGWGYQDTHETLNTFRWGPDGWLYGCHGVFTHSKVGKPGTPDAERVPINSGYWRFHPKRNEFEVFAHGTSNSWGTDFDENGQLFAEACVIPHLFHIAQGGRYQRQAGEHFDKNTYEDIKTIADHRHFVGNQWNDKDRSASADLGGGHAHAGLMIPQGAGWPDALTGKLMMGNIHGQVVNMDIPVRAGSGFIGKHGENLIVFNDPASQVVDIRQGPGGAAFLIDWYDLNQCHNVKREAHDYTTGRIYRLAKKGAITKPVNLSAESNEQLVVDALSPDVYLAKNARRILQEKGTPVALPASDKTAPGTELRTLWARHAMGADEKSWAQGSLLSPNEYVRAWAIQLACEKRDASSDTIEKFAQMAKDDPSPVVRLYLASAAQRLTIAQRQPIVEALVAHGEDAADVNLPLMYWYALEPVVGANPAAAATLVGEVKIPKIQEFIARRMAATAAL